MPSDTQKPDCPVEEAECSVIDQLVDLRRESGELKELVHTDTLTGLFNYRHFKMALEQEMERTHRTGQPTSLVLLDLDHFKGVNDTWGHEAGNRALHHTASLLRAAVRKIDIPCRYGGEEFALILPGTQLPFAVNVAERLRRSIAAEPLRLDKGEIEFTASMGVDIYLAGQEDTPESFVERVDKLLYKAKEQGRNRVCHSDLKYLRPESEVSPEEKRALFGEEGMEEE
jgi:diguanylate cyclase (GGDEF)-like protein